MGPDGSKAGGLSAREETERAVSLALDEEDYEAAAIGTLDGYGSELVSFFMAVLRDENEASECFADLCEALWRNLPKFRQECSVRTWCYVLARSAIARRFRDPHRRPDRAVALSQAPEVDRLAARVRTATLEYLRTGVKDRFAKLRDQLSLEQQTLLVLRVDRALSWTDIARIVSEEPEPSDEHIKRKAASLRKQFQRTKDALSRLARAEGLLA